MAELNRLWRGDLPLAQAFWVYGVAYGLAINLLMSASALAIYALFGSALIAIIVHFVPLPYNILACAGAWKSTERSDLAEWKALATKLAIVGLFASLLML